MGCMSSKLAGAKHDQDGYGPNPGKPPGPPYILSDGTNARNTSGRMYYGGGYGGDGGGYGGGGDGGGGGGG